MRTEKASRCADTFQLAVREVQLRAAIFKKKKLFISFFHQVLSITFSSWACVANIPLLHVRDSKTLCLIYAFWNRRNKNCTSVPMARERRSSRSNWLIMLDNLLRKIFRAVSQVCSFGSNKRINLRDICEMSHYSPHSQWLSLSASQLWGEHMVQ